MRLNEALGRVHQRLRATRLGRIAVKIIIGALGGMVIMVGLVLVPLPGPGWLIVLAGLLIWALEFQWARRLARFTRAQLERWWAWLRHQHWTVRVAAGLVGLIIVAAAIGASLRLTAGWP